LPISDGQTSVFHGFGQLLLKRVAIGVQHLGDAVELGGGFGHARALAGDQHMHVAADPWRRSRGARGVVEGGVVVFSNEPE
jgi:hypothetical protein